MFVEQHETKHSLNVLKGMEGIFRQLCGSVGLKENVVSCGSVFQFLTMKFRVEWFSFQPNHNIFQEFLK